MPLRLTINSEGRTSESDPMTPLLDVLRGEFFLTGTKSVCREGFCGACTVLVDGTPTLSCLTPAGVVEGCEVRTIEGISPTGRLNPIQTAFEAHDAVQCGMCFPGMVVALTHYLSRNTHPTRDDVRAALTGNICRCTGYERIIDAVLEVAAG